MKEGFKFKPEDRAEKQKEIDAMVSQLESYGAEISGPNPENLGSFSYKAKFPFNENEVVVNIWFELKDWQTDSDVVITNMTTLPDDKKGGGFGSKALGLILEWAEKNNLKEIRATQISNDRSASFWENNGFKKVAESSTGDYLFPGQDT